ncbi:hypothetical protein GYMLUDRAFT_58606 [Collybiopsis luxurians FD-317 M1]|uniref:Uncharacterized protein n=1 Tax=Collybiopsis luxurians FD-317 M1 TaxID=944289 RepID=A0A0D0C1X6_9AGAR|nr:hypothetical protein GYMLUDRAFT_58606 [Collybiopsis luxurians FD-317 M1]
MTIGNDGLLPAIPCSHCMAIAHGHYGCRFLMSLLNITLALDNPGEFSMPRAFIYELALFDFLTNQTQYRDTVQSYLASLAKDNPDFEGPYILGCKHSLDTALDSLYHQYAENSWAFGSSWTLTEDDEENGRFPVSIDPSSVYLSNLSGYRFPSWGNLSGKHEQLLFWRRVEWYLDQYTCNRVDNNSCPIEFECLILIHAFSSFFVLSALFAEASSNQTYMHAANLTLPFFENLLVTGSEEVKGGIGANNCSSGGNNVPYNVGIMIEGLAIMNSLDMLQFHDVDILYRLIRAATENDDTTSCQPDDSQGVINSTASLSAYGSSTGGGDSHLVRGMVAVYRRSNDSMVWNYARAYLAVQYNAAVDQGTVNGSIYGPWIGPPSPQYNSSGPNQTTALSILVNAIGIGNDTASSPSTPTKPPSHSTSHHNSVSSLNVTRQTTRLFPLKASLRSVTETWSVPSAPNFSALSREKRRHNQPVSDASDSADTGNSIANMVFASNNSRASVLRDNRVTEFDSHERRNRRDLTTEELFQILNQRVQPGPHLDNELPPDYSNLE